VVGRFLGLLELYRDGSVAFDQAEALTELRVRWTAGDSGPIDPDEATSEGEEPSVDEEYG
jgi:segregation and condensation protein A